MELNSQLLKTSSATRVRLLSPCGAADWVTPASGNTYGTTRPPPSLTNVDLYLPPTDTLFMRPLFPNSDVKYTHPEFRVMPRTVAWNFPDEQLWGRLVIGPTNAIHWWLLPRNWYAVSI